MNSSPNNAGFYSSVSAEIIAGQRNSKQLAAMKLGAALSVSLLAALAGGSNAARADGMKPDCVRLGYDYAGQRSDQPVNGVSAKITELSEPDVLAGHVAGWVGVGGDGSSSNEWLQAGIGREYGQTASRIYYEKQLPNRRVQYVSLGTVSLGHAVKLEVLEEADHRNYWTIYVNDYPKASDSRLTPQINGESYNQGPNYICNRFSYRFDHNRVKYPGKKRLMPLAHPNQVTTSGFGVTDLKFDGFVTASLH